MADTNPIIFRTYKTYGGYYVYDRHTNSVITLSREEFQELQAVACGKGRAADRKERCDCAVSRTGDVCAECGERDISSTDGYHGA